jgi:hydrogenase maturation protein HypF
MAEHALDGPVIGLALDGTGYGTDGRIWGGEVLICCLDGFERFAHLDYAPMPGGEAAVREPWRMAFGHLHAAGFDITDSAILKLLGRKEQDARVLTRMIQREVNSPLTSSLGRLFDAVASVTLHRSSVDYEAQAAIELEGVAVDESFDFDASPYEMELRSGDWARREPSVISTASLWRGLIDDLGRGVPPSRIASRFHASIVLAFVHVGMKARAATGIDQIALSGGCMHNRRLARLLRTSLEAEGFRVFQHRAVSPGDGGLSYGQAAVGAAILRSSKA